jgi:hypothetical protein
VGSLHLEGVQGRNHSREASDRPDVSVLLAWPNFNRTGADHKVSYAILLSRGAAIAFAPVGQRSSSGQERQI